MAGEYAYWMRTCASVPPKRESCGIYLSLPRHDGLPRHGAANRACPDMAGGADEFLGEAGGRRSALRALPQEPRLDTAMDVRGNRGGGGDEALLPRFEEVSASSGAASTRRVEKLARAVAAARPHDAVNAWDLDRPSSRHGRARARRATPTSANDLRRRAWRARALAGSASRTDMLLLGRADQKSRRDRCLLERYLKNTRGRWSHHPRPLLPRQASPAGSSSSTAPRIPWEATPRRARARGRRLAQEERRPPDAARSAAARELEWVRMSPRAARPRARRAFRPRRVIAESSRSAPRAGDRHPRRSRMGDWWRGRSPRQGLGTE